MPPAATNRVRLSLGIETTYAGATLNPTTLQRLRQRGETLEARSPDTVSDEIREDLVPPDYIQTDFEAGGSINFELSYGAFDDNFLLGAAQQTQWAIAQTLLNAASATFDAAAGTITGTGISTNAVKGAAIRVSGAANAANNGYFVITNVATGVLTVAGPAALVNATDSAVTVVQGAYLRNGVTQSSFLIERQYTDLSNVYAQYPGSVLQGLTLETPTNGIITGSAEFLCKAEVSATSSRGSSLVDAPSNQVMSSVTDVLAFMVGSTPGAANRAPLTALTKQWSLDKRGRKYPGSLGNQSIGQGRYEVTGTARMYFENTTYSTLFLNNTRSSITEILRDPAGNAYVFHFPRVRFRSGPRNAQQGNDDVVSEMTWAAMLDPNSGALFHISRFPAA